MSDEQAPLIIGPVIGMRAWRVTEKNDRWRLTGYIHRTVWPAGEPLVASCLNTTLARYRAHFAPKETCTCGIYGAAKITTLRDYAQPLGRDGWMPQSVEMIVVGTARLWGRVVEHTQGYRASHAYPDTLIVCKQLPNADEVYECLADYQVPVHFTNHLPLAALAQFIATYEAKT
jgi:hypothetical protein